MTLASLVVPTLRWDAAHGFEYLAGHIDDALEIGVGGFLIAGAPREAVTALAADLHARSGVPLLLAANAERGAGEEFTGCTELPPLDAVLSLGDMDAMRRAARITARELKQLGLNWALAPACDVEGHSRGVPATAGAPAADPDLTASLIAEWIDACQAEGVLACAMRRAPAPAVRDTSLASLEAAADAGVASLMLADGIERTLAPLRAAGFDGLVATGAFNVDGRHAPEQELERAARMVESGYDIILAPADLLGMVRGLDRAAQQGTISANRIRAALDVRTRWAQWGHPGPARATSMDDLMWSRQLADRCVHMLRGERPAIGEAVEVVELGAPGLAAPSAASWFVTALRALGVEADVVAAPTTGTRVPVLIAVFGAPDARPITEARDLAARQHRESLLVHFASPAKSGQLPSNSAILCGWSAQRGMQEAAARAVVR